jgi:carbon-monoxide dehydrogenase iron sulfur subunit
MPTKRISVHKDLCTGCRACQVACVARHEGVFGVSLARIRVSKNEPLGLDTPETCHLCGRAPCVAACPTKALYTDTRTSAVLLRSEDCIACSACVEACPFGMVLVHHETGLPLICDLCDGEPECVKRCPTGAITYGDPRQEPGRHPAMGFVSPAHPIPGAETS